MSICTFVRAGCPQNVLGYSVTKACASPRNSTWFTNPLLIVRGWGLGTRLIRALQALNHNSAFMLYHMRMLMGVSTPSLGSRPPPDFMSQVWSFFIAADKIWEWPRNKPKLSYKLTTNHRYNSRQLVIIQGISTIQTTGGVLHYSRECLPSLLNYLCLPANHFCKHTAS